MRYEHFWVVRQMATGALMAADSRPLWPINSLANVGWCWRTLGFFWGIASINHQFWIPYWILYSSTVAWCWLNPPKKILLWLCFGTAIGRWSESVNSWWYPDQATAVGPAFQLRMVGPMVGPVHIMMIWIFSASLGSGSIPTRLCGCCSIESSIRIATLAHRKFLATACLFNVFWAWFWGL